MREALCFGWVDSLVKRLDENVYAIKVTPRQPASKWSDPNRKRWKELQAAGLLARGAATVAVDSFSPPMLRPSVAFVLAFCGGLFEFKVEALLQKYVTDVGKRAGNV